LSLCCCRLYCYCQLTCYLYVMCCLVCVFGFVFLFFFFQAEDGIRDATVTGVQTCALPILPPCVEDRLLRLARGADHPRRRALHGLARPAGSRLAARAVLPLRRVRRGGAARLAVPPQPAAVRPAAAPRRPSRGAALRGGAPL